MSTAAVRRHWRNVLEAGCEICGQPAEIAHCHGGSIVERMLEPKAKGVKLPRYDWLVIALCPYHHRLGPARKALDVDVDLWELEYGKQASFIDCIAAQEGIDLWAKANEGRK